MGKIGEKISNIGISKVKSKGRIEKTKDKKETKNATEKKNEIIEENVEITESIKKKLRNELHREKKNNCITCEFGKLFRKSLTPDKISFALVII